MCGGLGLIGERGWGGLLLPVLADGWDSMQRLTSPFRGRRGGNPQGAHLVGKGAQPASDGKIDSSVLLRPFGDQRGTAVAWDSGVCMRVSGRRMEAGRLGWRVMEGRLSGGDSRGIFPLDIDWSGVSVAVMGTLRVFSAAEQVAAHLRDELRRGTWRGELPGAAALAAVLGVNHKTVKAAQAILEREGLLVGLGARQRRRIVLQDDGVGRPLRVGLMLYEASDTQVHYIVELQHLLIEAGHQVLFAPRSLSDLRMDVQRVARAVGRIAADAWVVVAGSREVIEWFAAQPTPTMAMFGRQRAVPIAGVGVDHLPAMLAATRRLIEFGHRRIVRLVRPERRIPQPGQLERVVLAEIAANGIPVGPYNLPHWDDSREGLYRCLDELCRISPPTALVIDEAPVFTAVQQHLARGGRLAPEHVSLICSDPAPTFGWFEPPITHIRWDSRPLIRRIVRWVAGVARGRDERHKFYTKAEFVAGGTIGPARK